jgi:CDP-diacylglycerol--serine O-phosphatidyltransferase
LGWALALVYAVCCALRLARFNTVLSDENPPPWASNFFTGVPAPAAAGLALLPMAFSFTFGDDFFRSTLLNGVTILAVAGLMISRVPTFSAKRLKIKRQHAGPVLVACGAFAAFLVSTPWVTLCVAGVLYIGSFPFSVMSQRRMRKAYELETPPHGRSQ